MAFPFKILSKVALKIGKKEVAQKFAKFFSETAINKIRNIGMKLKQAFQFTDLSLLLPNELKPKNIKFGFSKMLSGGSVTTTKSEDDENGDDLEKETEDDSDDITPIIVVTTAAVGGAIAAAAVATKVIGDGFNMPDIKLDYPKTGNKSFDISKFDFGADDIPSVGGHPKGFTQGKRINVQNTTGQFEYKRTQMASAQYGNPLNIRPSQYRDKTGQTVLRTDKWEGLTGMHYIKGAGYFLAFSDPYYSFRAAARNIMTYQKRSNLYTVHDWLYTYCPTNDLYAGKQATQAYVDDVVKRANATGLVNITEYSRVDITDKNVYIAVLKGMAWHESNLNVSIDYLSKCYEAQFHGAPKPLQDTMVVKNNVNGGSFIYGTETIKDNSRKQSTERAVKKKNG